jgi:hypothetical protein
MKTKFAIFHIRQKNQSFSKNIKNPKNDFRFSKFLVKNYQEMWLLYFSKTLKNSACAQLREIRMNQVISAHANFNRTPKILGSVQQRKFIRASLQRKGTFLGRSAYQKISVQPQLRFLRRPSYQKINKGRRADSCEADEGVDSGSKWLLHLSDVSRL